MPAFDELPLPPVLLVDDRPENLLALEAVLEPLALETVRAGSGEEALKEVLQRDFAVILMDVQMPGMDGFEAAGFIKSRDRSRATPIIFLTAISKEEEYVFKGYDVGAVDYIFKPFQPEVLRGKVAVFVELFQRGRQLQVQSESLRDAERRERELRHRAEIFESEARLRQVVDSALDAIVTFDEKRCIDVFNAAAEALFQRSVEDSQGTEVETLFDDATGSDLRRWVEATERIVCGEEAGEIQDPSPMILHGVRPDDTTFLLETSLSCLSLPDGRVYTLIGRDISGRVAAESELRNQAIEVERTLTELERVHAELEVRQKELEDAMVERSRFYSAMSHELRTPINAILGYTSLILEGVHGEVSDTQLQSLERVRTVSRHLLDLVNDILDLSKIESGKADLDVAAVDVGELVEDLFLTVGPIASEHGSTLAFNAGSDGVEVDTDARRVRQILLNLLSNAVKFGEGEPIEVVCERGDDNGLLISVRDHGRGISEEDLRRVFDEFVQLSAEPGREGTGLGLSISKRLAALLGGALRAESQEGKGSTFTLCLPARVEEQRAVTTW